MHILCRAPLLSLGGRWRQHREDISTAALNSPMVSSSNATLSLSRVLPIREVSSSNLPVQTRSGTHFGDEKSLLGRHLCHIRRISLRPKSKRDLISRDTGDQQLYRCVIRQLL